jgi:hypothetical protein
VTTRDSMNDTKQLTESDNQRRHLLTALTAKRHQGLCYDTGSK